MMAGNRSVVLMPGKLDAAVLKAAESLIVPDAYTDLELQAEASGTPLSVALADYLIPLLCPAHIADRTAGDKFVNSSVKRL